jgi:hypothetical protein
MVQPSAVGGQLEPQPLDALDPLQRVVRETFRGFSRH